MSKYLEILLSDCRPAGPEERSQTEPPFTEGQRSDNAREACADWAFEGRRAAA